MTSHFKILEAVNNKSGLDLWYDKGEVPQFPMVKILCLVMGLRKPVRKTQTRYQIYVQICVMRIGLCHQLINFGNIICNLIK